MQQSDLNGFLFAELGTEAGGMRLSVLSVLARLGVDPWQEAARLAKLPRPAAAEGLAGMIADMPASLWPPSEAAEIAARLVALLPARGKAPPALAATSSELPAHPVNWLIVVILLGGLIGGLTMSAHRRAGSDPVPPAAPADTRP